MGGGNTGLQSTRSTEANRHQRRLVRSGNASLRLVMLFEACIGISLIMGRLCVVLGSLMVLHSRTGQQQHGSFSGGADIPKYVLE
jgi:hypothetical protein